MVSGFALAAAITSASELNGRDGCVASTFGAVPINITGSRSLVVSKGRLNRNGLTAWVSNTNSQVLPSGGDFATRPVPTLPDAPGLFSLLKGALSLCCRPGWTMRAMGSVVPPGGKGTMILMMPEGQVCACAASCAAKGAAMPPSTSDRREIFMTFLLGFKIWPPVYNCYEHCTPPHWPISRKPL